MSLPVSFEDIVAAQKRLAGIAHHTPAMTSKTADQMTGAELFFKCENLQRMGAFKFRGAYNAISQFTPAQLSSGVVAYSSGNHAQAIALAARLLGTKSVIIMPEDAPQSKVEATRGYGGEIVLYDRYKQDRDAIGNRLAEERQLTLIPPYNHPHVIAGQGTSAMELMDDVGNVDILLAPCGGGGLICGCAIAAKKRNPKCVVIAVEPEAGNDAQQSFRTGKIVHIDTPKTIADGAQTQHLGEYTFAIIRELIDDIVTVSDAQLVEAMKFFASRMKIVVEPTGCLAAAAVFNKIVPVQGKRVGIVLSGGNVDPLRFAELVQGAKA